MKKICKNCNNCYTEYTIGSYPTPVCTLHGYLEELDNPYHNIGENCPDYTYPTIVLRGSRAKIIPIDDWKVPEELKEMINEIHLMEDILGENNDKC
jgi:hypothetical protein